MLFYYLPICIDDCSIKNLKDGVHLTKLENGRPSGEAYIELTSKLDLERALKKNRRYMGHRYIEGNYLSVKIQF